MTRTTIPKALPPFALAALACGAAAQCPASAVFAPEARYPAGPSPQDLVVTDLNNDGSPDIVTTLSSTRAFAVLINNGDGTFAPPVQVATPAGTSFGITAADLNNDANADIIVGGGQAGYVTVLLGDGTGGFGPPTEFGAGVFGAPLSIAPGDFDGDGNTDLAVVTGSSSMRFFRGFGDGTLGAPDFLFVPTSTATTEARVAHMNADADPDVVVGDFSGIFVLAGTAGIGFSPGPIAPYAPVLRSTDVADFDNDGDLDVIATGLLPGDVSVWLNNGAGGLSLASTLPVASVPYGVRAADFNNDGNTDAVVALEGPGGIALLLGDGAGTLTLAATFPGANQPYRVAVDDLDGNGLPDAAVVNRATGDVSVYLNACPANCSPADLAPPVGQLTFADITAFLAAFTAMDPAADLAPPFGSFTFADLSAFLAEFAAGCP